MLVWIRVTPTPKHNIEWIVYRVQSPTVNLAWKIFENKMAEVERSWTDQQLQSDEVSKKDIIKFLHEHASFEVLETYFCCLRFSPSFEPGLSTWLCFLFFTIGNNNPLEHFAKRRGFRSLPCGSLDRCTLHIWYGWFEMLALFYMKVSFYEILTESRKVIPFGLKPYLTPFIHVHKTACEIACRN